MPDTEKVKKSSGRMERILLMFIVPVLFTVMITFVLLSIMDHQMLDSVLRTANSIPVVGKLIPSPKTDDSLADEADEMEASSEQADEDYQVVLQLLEGKERELNEIREENQSYLATIAILQDEVLQLEQNVKQQELTEEEYVQKISQVSRTYADMMPSRAASIMQNLTLNEIVLLLEHMRSDSQTAILEKLPPQLAADVSVLLKDSQIVENRQIAALQERIQELIQADDFQSESLSAQELSQTIASMPPHQAAQLLLTMNELDANQVITILRVMSIEPRSAILSAMNEQSEETAARIALRLSS